MLADLAEVTGLTGAFSGGDRGLRERRSAHDPGRVLVDVAVLLADRGETISDLGEGGSSVENLKAAGCRCGTGASSR